MRGSNIDLEEQKAKYEEKHEKVVQTHRVKEKQLEQFSDQTLETLKHKFSISSLRRGKLPLLPLSHYDLEGYLTEYVAEKARQENTRTMEQNKKYHQVVEDTNEKNFHVPFLPHPFRNQLKPSSKLRIKSKISRKVKFFEKYFPHSLCEEM